jgi:hypothetical protein
VCHPAEKLATRSLHVSMLLAPSYSTFVVKVLRSPQCAGYLSRASMTNRRCFFVEAGWTDAIDSQLARCG